MRERRLIELILNAPKTDTVYGNIKLEKPIQTAQTIADHLLANGVVVPPCKVGDTCWYIRHYLKKHHIIVEGVVDDAVYTVRGGWAITVKAIKNHFRGWLGETVFLAREEAEKALEGRKV